MHRTAAGPSAHLAVMSPQVVEVNCGNEGFGVSGGQWYFAISCSLVNATSWTANVLCSDNLVHSAGPFTTFENVQVFCPVGTVAEEGWVSYTT